MLWKTEYLDGCSTTIRHIARKVAVVEGRLVCLEVTSLWGCISRRVDLYMTVSSLRTEPLSLTELIQSPIKFIQKSCDST